MAIVTMSLNPTIDVASEADLVRPTHKVRTSNETYDPGGGGVNVARVICELGGDAEVICPAGGFSGNLLDELLGQAGIRRTVVPIKGNTRVSFTVFERKSGLEYRFIPNGPRLSGEEVEACLEAVRRCECTYFVASGSVPLGAPTNILAQIAEIVREKGARSILDSSGAGLSVTLERVPVYMVKPSIGELEALQGRRLDDAAARDAAMSLVERGRAEIVAVTLGAAGAMVATKDGVLRMAAPRVTAHSAVGAGDSFVGAMTLALSQGRSIADALTFAVAAGAATVLTGGTRLCLAPDVERIYAELAAVPEAERIQRLG
jgi:6-phosphofructokinase 2